MNIDLLPFLKDILYIAVILIGTLILAQLVGRFFRRLIKKSSEDLQSDPTNYKFLRHAVVAIVYTVGIGLAISTIPQMRTLAKSMLAGAGLLAVAVGFASQQALGNIISGLFIVVFKPFRVNDRIELRTFTGIVDDITLRHTVIRNFENRRIIIPNSIISEEIITNSDFDEEKICKWIEVDISYDSDLSLAKRLLRDQVMAHPLRIDGRNAAQLENGDPEVVVRVILLGDSGIKLRAWAWAKNAADAFILNSDLLEDLVLLFPTVGIEIPYPHHTIITKTSSHAES